VRCGMGLIWLAGGSPAQGVEEKPGQMGVFISSMKTNTVRHSVIGDIDKQTQATLAGGGWIMEFGR